MCHLRITIMGQACPQHVVDVPGVSKEEGVAHMVGVVGKDGVPNKRR